MAEEKKLKLTYGTFDLVGNITVIPDETFQLNLKGKNNKDFIYNRINMKMEDSKGRTFYLNAMDGYDSVKGKIIYANIKDSDTFEQMEVNFEDRFNEDILQHIDNRSFVSIALDKIENDEGKKVWNYKNFLALYDAIEYLKDRLETGMKIRVTGQLRYSTYNGNTQSEFQIGNVYLLSDEDKIEPKFTFRQNVILKENSLDLSEWENNLVANVNAEVLTRIKGQYQLLKLPMVLRATEENKELRQKVIDKFLKVESGKVRRIHLEGIYNTGYVGGNVQEEDLPEEALELIELGLYDKEEVLRIYANKDRVEEMLILRPVVRRIQGEKPQVDWSDDEYTLEDLSNLSLENPWEIEEIEDSDDDDLSFLDELD